MPWHYCWKSWTYMCGFIFVLLFCSMDDMSEQFNIYIFLSLASWLVSFPLKMGQILLVLHIMSNFSFLFFFLWWVIFSCVLDVVSVTLCRLWVLWHSSEDRWCFCFIWQFTVSCALLWVVLQLSVQFFQPLLCYFEFVLRTCHSGRDQRRYVWC